MFNYIQNKHEFIKKDQLKFQILILFPRFTINHGMTTMTLIC